MNVPCLWQRNDKGGYDIYKELPYPTKDWIGRTPQYILVDDVSADGKVLAADIVDYSGFLNQPLVICESEDGEWYYTILAPNLLNPEQLEFPPYPGECPAEPDAADMLSPEDREKYDAAMEEYFNRIQPEITDFMTPDELDEYFDAYDLFMQDPENNPYPSVYDYISEEGMQAYNDAVNAYWDYPYPSALDYLTPEQIEEYNKQYAAWEVAAAEWAEKNEAFETVYYSILGNQDVPTFYTNSSRISPNGRYFLMNAEMMSGEPINDRGIEYDEMPYVFDLKDDTFTKLEGVSHVIGTQVDNTGRLLGATPKDSYSRDAVISPAYGQPMQLLSEYVKDNNADLYGWMEKNLTKEVIEVEVTYNPETDMFDEVEKRETRMYLGTPVANGDMSLIATWIMKNWEDASNDATFVSYLFPMDWTAGLQGVVIDSNDDVYYDLTGRRVVNPERGIYIHNGKKVLVK